MIKSIEELMIEHLLEEKRFWHEKLKKATNKEEAQLYIKHIDGLNESIDGLYTRIIDKKGGE